MNNVVVGYGFLAVYSLRSGQNGGRKGDAVSRVLYRPGVCRWSAGAAPPGLATEFRPPSGRDLKFRLPSARGLKFRQPPGRGLKFSQTTGRGFKFRSIRYRLKIQTTIRHGLKFRPPSGRSLKSDHHQAWA